MPSVFATRFFDVASPRLQEHLGGAVALSRGANSTASVAARWIEEDSDIETQTSIGVMTSHIDREWVIAKTAYLINSVAVTPAAGDRLTDSDSVVWEVMSQPGLPAAEPYGGNLEWLLRTKRIST